MLILIECLSVGLIMKKTRYKILDICEYFLDHPGTIHPKLHF